VSAAPAVRTLFTAAAASYAANCALGAAVWFRFIDTSRYRWVHHAIYLTTCALAVAAGSAALWARPGSRAGAATLALAPAAVPLAVIPYAGTRTRRHPLIALTAAPFFAAAVVRSWRK
jgi:hypothetical protein